MLQRQGVIAAPHFHKCAEQAHAVEHHRQAQPGHPDENSGAPHAFRQRAGQASIPLAGHRHEALFRRRFALQPKRKQRECQQNQRVNRRLTLIKLRADNSEVNFSRHHTKVATQNDGVAEVRNRLDKAHQKCVGQTRRHQR